MARNLTGAGNRNRRGTGTVGIVFQDLKPEPEPLPSVKTEENFPERTRRNRKPEPLEPSHARTITEPNPEVR